MQVNCSMSWSIFSTYLAICFMGPARARPKNYFLEIGDKIGKESSPPQVADEEEHFIQSELTKHDQFKSLTNEGKMVAQILVIRMLNLKKGQDYFHNASIPQLAGFFVQVLPVLSQLASMSAQSKIVGGGGAQHDGGRGGGAKLSDG